MTEVLLTNDFLLGEIPAGWEVQPLKRLVQVQNTGSYGANPSSELINLPVATTAQIDSVGRFRVEKMPKRGFTERESLRFICKPNDILVVKSSGSMANIITGKLGIVDQFIQPFVFSNFLLRLVPSDSRIKPRFLYHVLGSHLTVERIRRMVSGSTYPNLKTKEYLSALIPFPSVQDQVLILRYLDHAELRIAKAIQAKQKMVALLNEQKQVIISELVTRGLDPDVPMKDSGQTWLGQIPAHWDLHRMKSQFDEIVKKGRPDLPLLAATQSMGVVTKESYGLRTVTATRGLENLKIVEPGDFVISLRSFQGGLEISYANGIISPAYTILRAKDGTNNQFFRFMFKSKPFLSAIQMTITGIREGQNVDYRRLGLTMIPIPPRDEQIEINNAVTSRTQSIDRASEALLREIELLKEYRTVLISDVVTGKKDVRAEASGLPEVDPAELAQVLSGAVSVDGEEDEVDGASETE